MDRVREDIITGSFFPSTALLHYLGLSTAAPIAPRISFSSIPTAEAETLSWSQDHLAANREDPPPGLAAAKPPHNRWIATATRPRLPRDPPTGPGFLLPAYHLQG